MNSLNLEKILKMSDRAAAFIELISLYFYGGDEMRQYIVSNWDFGVSWELPNQARLTCKNNERWSCQQRIEASLAYSAIAVNYVADVREELIALAVIYQSCIFSSLEPDNIFKKVAKVSVPSISAMLINFIDRKEEDKSLAAFFLSAERNDEGEIEIRPTWNVKR